MEYNLKNCESLYYTPANDILLYINYISVKNK